MKPQLGHAALLAVLVSALATSARADTIYLKDGRVLAGRVIDRGDDTVFLERALGGIPVRRRDILRIEIEEVTGDEAMPHDVVVLMDGGIVRGDAKISPDGSEVVVVLGERGEVHHPRADVSAIHWRDGRKEGAAGAIADPLQDKLDRLVAALTQQDAQGHDDVAAQERARSELLSLGVFAKSYLASLEGEAGARVAPILVEIERMEGVRRVLPAALEQRHPRLVERLVAADEAVREQALRSLVMEEPRRVGPLLLHLVRSDDSPRVRALCVSQLASLRRFEELAEVLKLRDGPLRLAAAFALGDAGIYAGVPVLIEALRIDDLTIRSAAAEKLRQYTHQHFGFRAEATEVEREAAIAKWNAWWNEDGMALVRRSIKQAAPGLQGARVSDEEAAEARALWDEANGLLVAADRGRAKPGAPADPAEARERAMRLERAQDLLWQALQLDPSLVSARMTRAVLLYEELGRSLEARQELNRLIDRAEHDRGDSEAAHKFANYHLGHIALREQSWERAALRFAQALQYDPTFVDAIVAQGDAYLGQAFSRHVGQSPERQAQALDSARRAFQNALVALEGQYDDLVAMVEELQRSASKTLQESTVIQSVRRSQYQLAERKASVYFRLGRLHAALKDDLAALRSYRQAQELDPENRSYQEAVRLWEQLAE